MKNLIKTIAICLFLTSCNSQTKNELSPIEFEKEIQKDNTQILDVRTKEEFTNGHIKNALQANWNEQSEFTERTSALDKNKTVYVYCLAGSRSAAAAKVLRENGYIVVELRGGINAWKQSNLSLEELKKGKGMTIQEFNSILKNNSKVLVDFGAKWCAPCKKMNPIIDKVGKENTDIKVVKLDADQDTEIVNLYKIEVLPTFYVFKDGINTNNKEGILTETELLALINK